MSIQAPQGILNIPNATLRVGKLAVDEVVGADTILNTVARNTILLVDDVAYHENKNWALKLPNAWAGEFECNTASAGNYSEFNFYNEGASSNAQGYNLTFNDTTVELRYDGSLLTSGTLASTVTGTGVRKVRLMFERTILSVTVDGVLVFTHDDTGGPRPRVYSTTAGGFLNFFTNGGALKNLKIVNEKWMSDGTSNIAYVGGGEVAVGKALAFNRVSNVSQIKVDSNVVTEFNRSKKLIKYPRVAMTANSDSGYVASASSSASSSAYNAFDNILYTSYWEPNYLTNAYPNADGAYTGGTGTLYSTNGYTGEYLQIQLPVKIKLYEYSLSNRTGSALGGRQPKNAKIFASNDGSTWHDIHTHSDNAGTYHVTNGETRSFQLDNITETYYKYYRLAVNSIIEGGVSDSPNISDWSLYGVPEYDPEAHGVDVVVKSVPNVPNTDWLEVYYEGKNYTSGNTVQDETTNDIDATIGAATTFDSVNKAWSFSGDSNRDGTEFVSGYLPSDFEGNQIHSVSMWLKFDYWHEGAFCLIGKVNRTNEDSHKAIHFQFQNSNTSTPKIVYDFWGNQKSFYLPGDIQPGKWLHMTTTYTGNAALRKMFVNGHELTSFTTNDNYATNLALDTSDDLVVRLGTRYPVNSSYIFHGDIANFRLFNRALTSDEIYQFYAYQKEYFGHGDLGMTLKAGRLGIGTSEPRAALDVNGTLRVGHDTGASMQTSMVIADGGNVGIGTTNPQYTLDVNGLASSKTSRVFEFTGGDSYARHFWLCSFLDAPDYHTNQLIKINYSVTYKRLTGSHSRNSIASGTVTLSDLWRYTTNGTAGEFQLVTLQDQKNELYYGQGRLPKWYYVRFNNRGYLILSMSTSDSNSAGYYIKGNVDFLTRPTAESVDRIFNGTVYRDSDVAQTEGFTAISDLYPTTGTDVDGWDSAMSSGSTAQNFVEATEGTIFKHGSVGIGTTNPGTKLDVLNNAPQVAQFWHTNASRGSYINIRNQTGTLCLIGADGQQFMTQETNSIGLFNTNTGNINYYTNGQRRAYLDSAGKFHAQSFGIYSDERIKDNITDVDDEESLEIIKQLQPKNFVMRENRDVKRWGFIAQDIEQLVPEVVSSDSTSKLYIKKKYEIISYNPPVKLSDVVYSNISVTEYATLDANTQAHYTGPDSGNTYYSNIVSEAVYSKSNVSARITDEVFDIGECVQLSNDETYSLNVCCVNVTSVSNNVYVFQDDCIMTADDRNLIDINPTDYIYVKSKDIDNVKTINYEFIHPTLISAVQQMMRIIDRLTERVTVLENR
jgi:hypothetical protein